MTVICRNPRRAETSRARTRRGSCPSVIADGAAMGNADVTAGAGNERSTTVTGVASRLTRQFRRSGRDSRPAQRQDQYRPGDVPRARRSVAWADERSNLASRCSKARRSLGSSASFFAIVGPTRPTHSSPTDDGSSSAAWTAGHGSSSSERPSATRNTSKCPWFTPNADNAEPSPGNAPRSFQSSPSRSCDQRISAA